MQKSPYTPRTITKELSGRSAELMAFNNMLNDVAEMKTFEPVMPLFIGARGVGKTSLLRSFQDRAEQKGYRTVWVTAGDAPLLEILHEELENLVKDNSGNIIGEVKDALDRLQVTINVGILSASLNDKPKSASPGRAFQKALTSVVNALKKKSSGLVIFIDELQESDDIGLRALAYTLQHLQAEGQDLPLVFAGAGLLNVRDVMSDAVTFTERFEYKMIDDLDLNATVEAIEDPAKKIDVRWDIDALSETVKRTEGYPFFIQLLGDKIWKNAASTDKGSQISVEDTQRGLVEFEEELEGFYSTRWKNTTRVEKEFLIAMAELGGMRIQRKKLAERLNKPTSGLSIVRRDLIDRGIVSDVERGILSFTAPGFSDFILRENGIDIENFDSPVG